MGYVLPSIRDYCSTQPDLQVPYVANTMTRARFETIHSALHFSNNDDMVPRTHPQFDRAFKVRPLIITLINVSKRLEIQASNSLSMSI